MWLISHAVLARMATLEEFNSTESTNSVSRFVEIKTLEPVIGLFVCELDCAWAKGPLHRMVFT